MKRWLAGALSLVLAPVFASAQQVEYYHLDALGSVRAVTDANGAIITRHDYEPYGEEWNEPATADTRRFTGKERDEETGADYFGARYYSAPLARFTTVDPVYTWRENLADPERWNRYAYARNNPLKYVDPDGRHPIIIPIALAAAFLLNNATNTNVTEGPTHDTIVTNSVIVAAGAGFAAGGLRAAGREVFEEAVENATGLPVGGLPSRPGKLAPYDPEFALRQGGNAAEVVPDAYTVVRGGVAGLPAPGTQFSGAVGEPFGSGDRSTAWHGKEHDRWPNSRRWWYRSACS